MERGDLRVLPFVRDLLGTRDDLLGVGGVAIDLHTSILSEVYMPETGLGWRLIDGADHDRYMRWARQEPEPPQLEMDFAMGMAP